MKKIKSEINKMRGMKPREAVEYFWSYYKIHLMFAAIILFFLALILQANFGKKKELVFSAMLVDTGIAQEQADALGASYAGHLELDPENQFVTMDASAAFEGGGLAGVQKMLVNVAAGETDVFLTDTHVADYLLKGGALSDLQVILPEETLVRLGGRLVYTDTELLASWVEANKAGEAEDISLLSADPAGMAHPVPVAVDVTASCAAAFDRPEAFGAVYLSVAVTTRRQEEAAKFLDYLDSIPGDSGGTGGDGA